MITSRHRWLGWMSLGDEAVDAERVRERTLHRADVALLPVHVREEHVDRKTASPKADPDPSRWASVVAKQIGGDTLALRRLRHRAPGEYLLQVVGDRGQERLVAAIEGGVPVDALIVASR